MNHIQRVISLCLLAVLSLTTGNAQTLRLSGNTKPSDIPKPVTGRPTAVASASTPCDFCVVASKPTNPKEIVVDARSGVFLGDQKFNKGDRVKITITNKNPFLYEYTVIVKEDKVTESVGDFLALLGGPIPDVLKPATPAPAKTVAGGAAPAVVAPPSTSCPTPVKLGELNFLLTALSGDNQRALDLSNSIATTLESLKTKHNISKMQFELIKRELANQNAVCNKLCISAREMASHQDGVTAKELDDVLAEIEKLQRAAKAIKDRVEYIRTAFADCMLSPDDKKLLDSTIPFADGLLAGAQENSKVQQAIRDDLAAAAKWRAAAEKVRRDETLLQKVIEIGPFETTTEVTVELKRKPIESKEEAKVHGSAKYKFGDAPFFTISGGIVFSTLAKREFDKVQGFELDRSGMRTGAAPTTIIGLKEEADTRLSPLVMLNGRIISTNTSLLDGVHVSLGVTAKNDGKNTNIEFLVGPSFSFLERNLFLTVGGYVGKQQKLAGDFYLGQKVDASTSVTVQSNYRWSFGAAITYKIK
ncbi:MAG: hypothetical protein SF097_20215 [Acidobacteriota bacterium]|nr:hypothetical protein [Acidobacteriota bacterium]